jgi:hypothetical protein
VASSPAGAAAGRVRGAAGSLGRKKGRRMGGFGCGRVSDGNAGCRGQGQDQVHGGTPAAVALADPQPRCGAASLGRPFCSTPPTV